MPCCRQRALAVAAGWIIAAISSVAAGQPPEIQPLPPPRPEPSVAGPAHRAPQAEFLGDRFIRADVQPAATLNLEVGHPKILELIDTPLRVYLPDDDTVTFDILDGDQGRIISLTGRQPGATTLTLWFRDPDAADGRSVVSYRLRVAEDPARVERFDQMLAALERDLNRSFPNSVVKLSYVGAEVLVRGKAKDVEEATQILRIVSRSLPTDEQEERLRELEAAQLNERGEVVTAAAEAAMDAAVASGLPFALSNPAFFDPDRIEQAGGLGGIARGRSITGANAAQINSRVVNMLEIAGVHQVQLKVTLAEVVRDAGRSLVTDIGIGNSFTRPGQANVDFTALGGIGEFTLETNRFFLQVEALKRLGLARSLAEPNLTSLNGQPANFLVGGQFPILESVSTVAAVNQNIRFIPFGVQLMVTPTVTDGDRIRLNLMATVSEQAGVGGIGGGIGGGGGGVGGGVQQNDPAQPPSLSTRSFMTTVELRSSESLAVAGLIRTSLLNNSVRVPFLGDIPVVGNLFSNNSTSFQEQELILVVTPHLVSPVPAGKRPPLPGSDSFEPDDLRFFLGGQVSGDIPEDYRSPVRDDLAKMQAFRRAEQKYIIGRPGHTTGQVLPPPRQSSLPHPSQHPVEISHESF